MTDRTNTLRKLGLTLLLAVSVSTLATSASFAFSAEAQQLCTGDAFRLCSSEIPNIAKITVCMRRNKANLSQGCRALMERDEAAAGKNKVAATQK